MFPAHNYSLRKRLVLAFGVVLVLFLGLAGFVLDRAFKESVAAAVQQRLELRINALVGAAEPAGEGFFLSSLEEARFSQIDSGLYGFILGADGEELWRSPSALTIPLDQLDLGRDDLMPGETQFGALDTPRHGRLAYARYDTYWADHYAEYSFVVMESLAPARAEIRQFQSSLWLWLGGLAVLLSAVQYLLLRWGLSPLRRLAHDVASVEAGEKEQLQGSYPAELTGVTDNLNLLIKRERERRARYRATLDDLAHSLKTPLAVIAGILRESPAPQAEEAGRREIGEQLERMDQIVSWQLKRAEQNQPAGILARPVPVKPALEKILRALDKVYRDKDVAVQAELADSAGFPGEPSDLMELAGNILDNAFKYCRSRVEVRATGEGRRLRLEIHDDGAGIPEAQRRLVLVRGARADTQAAGQGIGLTVARDIVASHGGELNIGTSHLGGTLIEVRFGDAF